MASAIDKAVLLLSAGCTSLHILEKRALERKCDRLIDAADYLGKDPRSHRGDQASLAWIEKKKKEYDMVFDIGVGSSSHSSAPTTPLKRKAEELVS